MNKIPKPERPQPEIFYKDSGKSFFVSFSHLILIVIMSALALLLIKCGVNYVQ